MKINKRKTEAMMLCREERENKLSLKLDDESLNNIKDFKYLGCKFTFDSDCSAEIRKRIAPASYS